jgi:hypothetical protein
MVLQTQDSEVRGPIVRWLSIDVMNLHATLEADATGMAVGDQYR